MVQHKKHIASPVLRGCKISAKNSRAPWHAFLCIIGFVMEGVPSNPKSALYGFPHFVCVLHNAAHMQSWKKEEK